MSYDYPNTYEFETSIKTICEQLKLQTKLLGEINERLKSIEYELNTGKSKSNAEKLYCYSVKVKYSNEVLTNQNIFASNPQDAVMQLLKQYNKDTNVVITPTQAEKSNAIVALLSGERNSVSHYYVSRKG